MKTILVLNKSDKDELLLEVKYKLDIDKNDGKVWSVEGEVNEVIGWHVDLSKWETTRIFDFNTGWEETVLNFKGEDDDVSVGYYQTDTYGLNTMAIAMMIPSYLAKKYIASSGVYMYEDELEFIESHPLLQNLEFKEVEMKKD